jgi:hypothetical protein
MNCSCPPYSAYVGRLVQQQRHCLDAAGVADRTFDFARHGEQPPAWPPKVALCRLHMVPIPPRPVVLVVLIAPVAVRPDKGWLLRWRRERRIVLLNLLKAPACCRSPSALAGSAHSEAARKLCDGIDRHLVVRSKASTVDGSRRCSC